MFRVPHYSLRSNHRINQSWYSRPIIITTDWQRHTHGITQQRGFQTDRCRLHQVTHNVPHSQWEIKDHWLPNTALSLCEHAHTHMHTHICTCTHTHTSLTKDPGRYFHSQCDNQSLYSPTTVTIIVLVYQPCTVQHWWMYHSWLLSIIQKSSPNKSR